MKSYTVDIYIFGEIRTVSFKASESLEELQHDDDMLNNYVLCALSEMMHIQSNLEEN